MAILGIGVDIASIERVAGAVARVPRLAERLFTPRERQLPAASLAARFAAKEAVAKALGSPGGMRWQDCEILQEASGQPQIRVSGTVERVARKRGVTTWHLSLSHDGGMAIALVIAEGEKS